MLTFTALKFGLMLMVVLVRRCSLLLSENTKIKNMQDKTERLLTTYKTEDKQGQDSYGLKKISILHSINKTFIQIMNADISFLSNQN